MITTTEQQTDLLIAAYLQANRPEEPHADYLRGSDAARYWTDQLIRTGTWQMAEIEHARAWAARCDVN